MIYKDVGGFWSHLSHVHVPNEGSIPSDEHQACVEEEDRAHGEKPSASEQER